MNRKIKILILEDCKSDVDLICWEMDEGDIEYNKLVVDNKADYISALNNYHPDLILSDHTLPQFNSLEALEIMLAKGSKIPFILVTGTMSEDFAVKVMKSGAWDYVSKKNLELLPNAIIKAMDKFDLEKVRRTFLYEAILTEAYMEEAEGIAHYGSWQHDMINNKFKLSKEAYNILGYFAGETVTSYEQIFSRVHPEDDDRLQQFINFVVSNPDLEGYKDSFRLINNHGKYRVIKVEFVLRFNLGRKLLRINGFVQDVTDFETMKGDLKRTGINSLEQETRRIDDAILILNDTGFIVGSNIEAQNMLGYSKEEIINMPVYKFYENRQIQDEVFLGYVKDIKNQVRFKNKSVYLRKNGSRLLANVVATILVNNEDKLTGYMLVLREITTVNLTNKNALIHHQPLVVTHG